MSEKTNRFNELFNKIGDLMLSELDMEEGTFDISLKLMQKKNKISYDNYQTLNSIRKMRNSIIHATSKEFMAEPFEETICQMKAIYENMKNPPRIIDYCNEVKHKFSSNDKMFQALRYMRNNDFSQVPIVDKGNIIGLFSMETVARWLDENIKKNDELIDTEIKNVNIYRENCNDYYILPANTTIYEAIDIFDRSLKQGEPLKAIIVTNFGKETDRILGILTPYDFVALIQKTS